MTTALAVAVLVRPGGSVTLRQATPDDAPAIPLHAGPLEEPAWPKRDGAKAGGHDKGTSLHE